MTSDATGPERSLVAPEGLRFSGNLQDGSGRGQPGGGIAQPRLQGRGSIHPLANGSFGSFDFAELLKAPPSAGDACVPCTNLATGSLKGLYACMLVHAHIKVTYSSERKRKSAP